jgi:antirestriction protein ArdC
MPISRVGLSGRFGWRDVQRGIEGVGMMRPPKCRYRHKTHRTAHESRWARDFGTERFGSEGYAMAEPVAERGAAFLSADLDVTLEPREDHAAYIASWLDVLTADNRAIFAAASHA